MLPNMRSLGPCFSISPFALCISCGEVVVLATRHMLHSAVGQRITMKIVEVSCSGLFAPIQGFQNNAIGMFKRQTKMRRTTGLDSVNGPMGPFTYYQSKSYMFCCSRGIGFGLRWIVRGAQKFDKVSGDIIRRKGNTEACPRTCSICQRQPSKSLVPQSQLRESVDRHHDDSIQLQTANLPRVLPQSTTFEEMLDLQPRDTYIPGEVARSIWRLAAKIGRSSLSWLGSRIPEERSIPPMAWTSWGLMRNPLSSSEGSSQCMDAIVVNNRARTQVCSVLSGEQTARNPSATSHHRRPMDPNDPSHSLLRGIVGAS